MIPPAKEAPKILNSKEKICQAFEIGPITFDKWVERGLPVIKDGRSWWGHYDDIENFMRDYFHPVNSV